jgi:amidophosphoribosyltransferase
MKRAVRAVNPRLKEFEASCFDGHYVTGDVTADYLSHLAAERDETRGEADADLALESRVVAG